MIAREAEGDWREIEGACVVAGEGKGEVEEEGGV